MIDMFVGESPVFAYTHWLDFPKSFKEQNTAWILGTHLGNDAGPLVGRIFVHATHMPPELLGAVFLFHRFARLPLLLGNALEMAVAMLIEATVGDKHGFDDRRPLSDGDHRQILDVEVNPYRHQVRRALALHDLLRPDLFRLGEVQ